LSSHVLFLEIEIELSDVCFDRLCVLIDMGNKSAS
jgi:hypothetical protein